MQTDLNEKAQKRFNELKSKLKLDVQNPFVKKGVELVKKEISETADPDEAIQIMEHAYKEAAKNAEIVDNTFAFIDSLELPAELSLAIGLIISAHKTKSKVDIANAVAALGRYCNE